jgi:hypothetical protein
VGIAIKSESDWTLLSELRATSVLDPMVVRCGELFLRGSGEAADKETTWNFLENNTYAVAMFFDRLVLDERIPVFNYGDTFDAKLNFDQRVFWRINDYEPGVLLEVDVQFAAYDTVKKAAAEELEKIYDGKAKISKTEAVGVTRELAAAAYEWTPNVDHLKIFTGVDEKKLNENEKKKLDEEKKLAAFLLGGLIFGGYAQLMEGEHVIQPKRSSLFLKLSLGKSGPLAGLDDALFADLKKLSNLKCDDLTWMPSFFPYLLENANSPIDLIHLVAELRKEGEIQDYRAWLREVLDEWKQGKVSVKKTKDIGTIQEALERKLRKTSSLPKTELKVTLAETMMPKPEVSVDLTERLQAAWGWVLSQLPTKRYRKLLTRSMTADFEYKKIGERMETIWTTRYS